MKSACVFSIDDAYLMPFQVFFYSLCATESIPKGTPVFILHTETLGSDSISKLLSFIDHLGYNATFLDASHLVPSDLPKTHGEYVSLATYYRLFLADILPPYVDHAVYLDADMIALRSISDLFSLRVDYIVAAVDHLSPGHSLRLWGELCGTYFQCGVLVIPVDSWRKENMSKKFVSIIRNHREIIKYGDQDVLNLAAEGLWHRLPVWYNMELNVLEAFAINGSATDVVSKSKIIHFSGPNKPWNSLCPSQFTSDWDTYYQAVFGTPFDRESFKRSRRERLSSSIRSRIRGLIHGSN